MLFFIFIQNDYFLLITIASVLEIYGVLLLLLTELKGSSYFKKWENERKNTMKIKSATWNKRFVIYTYENETQEKCYHYKGIGYIFLEIILNAERFIHFPNNYYSCLKWLFKNPTKEDCNITFETEAFVDGSNKHLQHQIDELKEYSGVKIFGFGIIFVSFILQFIYNVLNTYYK